MCGRIRITMRISEMAHRLGAGRYMRRRRSTSGYDAGARSGGNNSNGNKRSRSSNERNDAIEVSGDNSGSNNGSNFNSNCNEANASSIVDDSQIDKSSTECDSIFSGIENAQPGDRIPVFFKRRSNSSNINNRTSDNINSLPFHSPLSEIDMSMMSFGLIPGYTQVSAYNPKTSHFDMFNARAETVTEKVSFKNLTMSNRCVIVIDGYYEWKQIGKFKQPYYCHIPDQPMFIACLFDQTKWNSNHNCNGAQAENLLSFTIVTCDACDQLKEIHNRMPLILSLDQAYNWLGLENINDPSLHNNDLHDIKNTSTGNREHRSTNFVAEFLQQYLDTKRRPYASFDFEHYAVTPKMSNIKYQSSDCSIRESKKQPSMMMFLSTAPKIKSDITTKRIDEINPRESVTLNEKLESSGNMEVKFNEKTLIGSKRGVEVIDLT